jgi:hypothetical protein
MRQALILDQEFRDLRVVLSKLSCTHLFFELGAPLVRSQITQQGCGLFEFGLELGNGLIWEFLVRENGQIIYFSIVRGNGQIILWKNGFRKGSKLGFDEQNREYSIL